METSRDAVSFGASPNRRPKPCKVAEVIRRMKSETQFSSHAARENMFLFNAHDRNLNRPFNTVFRKLSPNSSKLEVSNLSRVQAVPVDPKNLIIDAKNFETLKNANISNDKEPVEFNVSEVEISQDHVPQPQ